MKRSTLIIALLIGFAGLGSSHALEELFLVEDQSISTPQIVDEQKAALRTQLELHMDDLDRICKLTEEQKTKLKVAIKGVIHKRFNVAADGHHEHEHDHSDHEHVHVFPNVDIAVQQAAPRLLVRRAIELVAPVQNAEDVAVPEADEPAADADEPAAEADEPAAEADVADAEELVVEEEQALQVDVEPVGAPAFRIVAPQQKAVVEWVAAPRRPRVAGAVPAQSDPLWQQTVDRILTPQQKQAHQAETDRRANVRTQATIAMGIAQATEQLMLSESQQEKFMRLCQAAVAKDRNAIHSMSNVHAMVQVIDFNRAKEFLSKAQQASVDQFRKAVAKPQLWGMPQLNQVDVPGPVFQVR